jgi:hypothetical protein
MKRVRPSPGLVAVFFIAFIGLTLVDSFDSTIFGLEGVRVLVIGDYEELYFPPPLAVLD